MLRCSHNGLPPPDKSLQEKTWHPHSPWDKEDSVTFLLLWRSQLLADSLPWMLRSATRNSQATLSRVLLKEKGTEPSKTVLRSGVPTACSPAQRLAFPSVPARRKKPLPALHRLRAGAGIVGTRQDVGGRPSAVSRSPGGREGCLEGRTDRGGQFESAVVLRVPTV